METLERQFNARVDAFLDRTGMPPTTFGMKAVGDPNLIRQIRQGRSISLRMADQIIAFTVRHDGEPGGARAPPGRRPPPNPLSRSRRTGRRGVMTERPNQERTSPPARILRFPEVVARTGLSRSTIYRLRRAGRFPQPVVLGARAVGWLESVIDEWIRGRTT